MAVSGRPEIGVFNNSYPMSESPQAKIFISHRSTDNDVAKALCDLIQSSFRLCSQDIICTSADAHGIENGKLSYAELKWQLQNANLVIYLLSKSFCESEDCHYEIAWGFDLDTAFYFHLDGVTSEHKPRCVCDKSMNNMTRIDLASLKIRLNEALYASADERKWAEKVEALIAEYGNYQKSKTHSVEQSVQEKQNSPTGVEEEKLKTLAEKIDRFNNHTTAVYILVDSVLTSVGKKYKDEIAFLPDEEAAVLVESRNAMHSKKRVHAYLVISDFDHYIHGCLRAGDIVPFTEDNALFLGSSCIVRLWSVQDLRTSLA